MSYQLIPNLVFFLCVLGAIILILRRLPEAQNLSEEELKRKSAQTKLGEKGIPAEHFSKILSKIKFWLHKLWALALEAKDLAPKPGAYNIKKIFQTKLAAAQKLPKPAQAKINPETEAVSEDSLLKAIKAEPKNWPKYDALGKFYLSKKQYQDAKEIYTYLVGHEPSSADYQARLAQCFYHLKEFALAEKHFDKSLALDKMHPNRYYNLGLSQECQEKWQKAAESFLKALEMDPQNAKFLASLEKAKKQLE